MKKSRKSKGNSQFYYRRAQRSKALMYSLLVEMRKLGFTTQLWRNHNG